MAKVAVCLSGCGFLDGAEIHEAVCTLLALDQAGADVPHGMGAEGARRMPAMRHARARPSGRACSGAGQCVLTL